MKLVSAQVTNFRSAEDSGEFEIEQVTCLVGKNEAGKSAVLLALAALNPHPATPASLDKERDYPRRMLVQYSDRHPKGSEALAVKTKWHLEESEISGIAEDIGPNVLTGPEVTIQRRYGKDIEITDLSINQQAALGHLYSLFKLDASERAVLASAKTTQDLIALLGTLSSPTAKHQELKKHLDETGTVTQQVQSIIKD